MTVSIIVRPIVLLYFFLNEFLRFLNSKIAQKRKLSCSPHRHRREGNLPKGPAMEAAASGRKYFLQV